MSLRDILLQIAQVLSVLAFAPLLQGAILQFEERVQRAQGPGLFQPYRDLWKLFHKQLVVPQTASWIYWAAPVVAFTAMLTVPILIPVLTDFPLPLSDMGDILGGGLILTLGSFMVVLAGLDSGSAYGGIGSSRAVMVAILAEPTLILVFVGISLLAKSMLPFVVNHLLVGSPAVYWSPAHLFLVAAFFILLLVETDRLPIHSSTHIEVYMIEEARILEYSGPLLALLKWASMMKQFILYTIFCNVLVLPWGLSHQGSALGAAASLAALLAKFLLVALRRRLGRDRAVAAALLPLSGAARRLVSAGRAGDHRDPAAELMLPTAARSARLLAVQPDGDREPLARLCDAGLALARQLSLRVCRAVLGDRRVSGSRSASSRTIPELYLVAALTRPVPRAGAALSDLADDPAPARSRASCTRLCGRPRRWSSARSASSLRSPCRRGSPARSASAARSPSWR